MLANSRGSTPMAEEEKERREKMEWGVQESPEAGRGVFYTSPEPPLTHPTSAKNFLIGMSQIPIRHLSCHVELVQRSGTATRTGARSLFSRMTRKFAWFRYSDG